jgi:TonB-linked SusC/RagA family outer membrane protein
MRKHFLLFVFLTICSVCSFPQSAPVTGKISDASGQPVSFASVRIKGTRQGVSADAEGNFSIRVKTGDVLIISAFGVTTREIAITGEGPLTVQVTRNEGNLAEVVVTTALGIKREKRQLTYSAQEIKGDALVAAKQDNIINDLAGKVPGVQVTNSTGMPGSSARIVIRGNTSLTGNNQALFIIDGIPMDNQEAGSLDGGTSSGGTSNRAIDIDPNLIESMTVLKGAAATALYGSAAARGAIIITTKNGGGSKKPQLTLSSSYSFDNPILPLFQDKYAQGFNNLYIDGNAGQLSSGSWGPLIDTLKVNGQPVTTHDPRKDFYRTGHTTDNTISVGGSSDKSKYFVSYSYLKNEGIMPTTDFARHSLFGKFTNQVTSNISTTIQLNYINSLNHRQSEGNDLVNPLWIVNSMPISFNPLPTTNPDGSQRLFRAARNNPYWILDNVGFVSNVNRFLPVATIAYSPLNWLTVTERIGADLYTDQTVYHEAPGVIGGIFGSAGRLVNRNENFRQYNSDLIIEARKQFGNDLFASLVMGNNIYSRYDEFYQDQGLNQTVPNFYNMSVFSTQTTSSNYSLYRKVGYYAQGNFEYKKMLNLALTGRYDGTSVLSTAKNYYPYGSAALGFIFSELMKGNSGPLSFGKARISYSVVGNDNLQPYSLTTNFNSITVGNIQFPLTNPNSSTTQNAFLLSSTAGNPTLVNEKLKEFELGLELKFLKNRLSFEGSYFNRKSSDLLTNTPIDFATGFTSAQLNAGTIQNKGFELLVSAVIIKTKDFSWQMDVNFSRIRNKVLSLAPGLDKLQFGGFSGGGGVYAFKGQPYGVLYGSKYERDSATHKILIDDNGLPLKDAQLGVIGNTNPDWTGGLSSNFTYHQFGLSIAFDMKKGGDLYNIDNHYNWFYGTPKVTENRGPRVVDGIRASDGKANSVAVSGQDYYRDISQIDEPVVEDGTFIKFRTLGISYMISPKSLSKTFFKNIVVNLTGKNLWIYKPHYTGSDPETALGGSGNGQGIVNNIVPTSRSFIAGLKVIF